MDRNYFFIGDVLGFKNIVTNSSGEGLDGKVESWISLVQAATERAGLADQPQLISDTVFARAKPNADGLRQLIHFSRYLLESGVHQSLLIRGAITFGPCHWGRLTYGRAVISAHELEMRQDWIGVCCDAGVPDAKACWGADGLVCYPPPFKEGLIRLHPAVVWNVPDAASLQRASLASPLVREGEPLQWHWRRRLRNTRDYGRYLEKIASENGDWSVFNGEEF